MSGQCDLPGPMWSSPGCAWTSGWPSKQLAEKGAAGALHLGDQHERLPHGYEGHGRGVYDQASP